MTDPITIVFLTPDPPFCELTLMTRLADGGLQISRNLKEVLSPAEAVEKYAESCDGTGEAMLTQAWGKGTLPGHL